MTTTKPESPEFEPPHGRLGEIREDIPFRKSQRDVPLPKPQRPSKPTQEKVKRSTRR
jgi:hypothetical protein